MSPTSGLIYPGSVLEEFVAHYKVTGKLGVGGMGEVYRATDTKLNREVAIKVLPATFRNDAERLARLQREAQVLGTLYHPNIAAIYGIEESEGRNIGDARVDLEQAIRDPSSSSLAQILKPFRDDTRGRDRKDFVLQLYAIPLHPRSHLMTAHHGSSIEVAPDCSRLAYCGLHEGLEQVFWSTSIWR